MASSTTLLEKAAKELTGIQHLPELAQKAVKVLTHELKEYNLAGAGVFKVDDDGQFVYAYEYTAQYNKIAEKFLKKPSDLKISLDDGDNLIVRAIKTNEQQSAQRLIEFFRGSLVEKHADTLQKFIDSTGGVTFPITLKNGKTVGAILFIVRKKGLTDEQIELLQAFAKMLGIAFFNVFAFEQMLDRYKKDLEHTSLSGAEKDIPSVKFTLRVTEAQNKKLQDTAADKGITKAELIREVIDTL